MSRMLAAVALAAFVAAMVVIAVASTGSNKTSATAPGTTTVPAATATRPAAVTTVRKRPTPLHLDPIGVYDPPPGDGRENDSRVPNAVDGDPTTSWSTEHYTQGFTKDGVGIVLDVGTRRLIDRVLVGTDVAETRAEIRLGDSATGPFRLASENQQLDGTTTFGLDDGATGRYLVVWMTQLSPELGEAHVTEVRAFAGP